MAMHADSKKWKPGDPITAAKLPYILEEVGVGAYHARAFVILAAVPFVHGACMLAMAVTSHAVGHELHLTDLQVRSLEAASVCGVCIGEITSGYIADLKGRRFPILLSFLGITITSVFMTQAESYAGHFVARIFHGTACGFAEPASSAMIVEMFPEKCRRAAFLCISCFSGIGECYTCLILMRYMPDFKEYRSVNVVIRWSAVPAFIMAILLIFTLYESVHWLLIRGYIAEAQSVIRNIAYSSGKDEIAESLGSSADLSALLTAGSVNDRNFRSEKLQREDEASKSIKKQLQKPETLRKICLFSLLLASIRLVTFGLDEVWPEILEETGERLTLRKENLWLKTRKPPQLLLYVMAVGIPLGLFVACLASFARAPHKLTIASASILGAAGMACMHANFEADVQVMVASILVAHGAAVMHSSMSLIFCEESFSTNLRSTATGLASSVGTISTGACLLAMDWIGLKRFLLVGFAAFLLGALAVLPLQETSGHGLQHFDGKEEELLAQGGPREDNEEEDGASEAPSSYAEDGASEAASSSRKDESTREMRENTTLSSVSELSMLFGLIGAVPGSSFTSFYVGMGYFIEEFQDRSIFVKQLLVGNGSQVPVLVMLSIMGPWLHRKLGISVSLLLLLVLPIFSVAFVNIFMAFPTSPESLLCLGLVQALICATMNWVAVSIACAISGPERPIRWFSLGFAAGTLVPVMMLDEIACRVDVHDDKSPLAHERERLQFFAVPASISLVTGLLYASYHIRASYRLRTSVESAGYSGNIRYLLAAYRQLELNAVKAQLEEGGNKEEKQEPHAMLAGALAFVTILLYQVSAYFFTALFPMLGSAKIALNSYLGMIVGEALGICFATGYNSFLGFHAVAVSRNRLQLTLLFILGLAAVAGCSYGGLTIVTRVSSGKTEPEALQKLVDGSCGIFCVGSFFKWGLEVLQPKVRKARLLGVLLGLSAALICYWTVLKAHNVPRDASESHKTAHDPRLRAGPHWPDVDDDVGPESQAFHSFANGATNKSFFISAAATEAEARATHSSLATATSTVPISTMSISEAAATSALGDAPHASANAKNTFAAVLADLPLGLHEGPGSNAAEFRRGGAASRMALSISSEGAER